MATPTVHCQSTVHRAEVPAKVKARVHGHCDDADKLSDLCANCLAVLKSMPVECLVCGRMAPAGDYLEVLHEYESEEAK